VPRLQGSLNTPRPYRTMANEIVDLSGSPDRTDNSDILRCDDSDDIQVQRARVCCCVECWVSYCGCVRACSSVFARARVPADGAFCR
jgi:hypothetical protein